jgi:hypothetical protein
MEVNALIKVGWDTILEESVSETDGKVVDRREMVRVAGGTLSQGRS